MASRIMHLCIAKLVAEKIDFKDKDSFYLGCLAPDLTWYGQGEYDKSHFGQTLDGLKGIDYVSYAAKYSKRDKLSDFQLGYKDMFKYNPILIKHYGLEPLGIKHLDEQMDEIDLGLFENLLADLKKDFLVAYMDELFHVYPKNAVLDFIDTAVNKSSEAILNIRREARLEESVHYYVPVK